MPKYLDETGLAHFWGNIKARFDKLSNRSRLLHTVRIGRLLDRFGYESVSRRLYSQSVCTYNGIYYSLGSYSSNASQNLTSFTSAGAVDDYKTFTELGHANSFITDGDVFVVADGSAPKLHIVDYSTWDYLRTITFSSFTNILSVSICDGTIYFWARDATRMYIVELSDTTASATYTILCTLDDVSMIGVKQNFCVYNGFAYFLYGYSGYVYKFDIETGELFGTYYARGILGELEDILIVDGQMVVTAPYHLSPEVSTDVEMACFVNLFQTDILGPIDVYESQPTIHHRLEVAVNESAATVFNPTTTFNTYEEACHVLNANHGGLLRVNNSTTHGAIILFDGVYSIVPASGGYKADALYVVNADVNIRQLTYGIGNIQASNVACTSVHFAGASVVNVTEMSCVSCSFDAGAAFTVTRSQCVFDKVAVVTEFTATISQVVGTTAKINSAYVAGIMKLAKLNRYLTVLRITSETLDIKCMITTANLNADDYTLTTDDATYPYVHILNGSVYLVDTDSNETELSANAIVEVH